LIFSELPPLFLDSVSFLFSFSFLVSEQRDHLSPAGPSSGLQGYLSVPIILLPSLESRLPPRITFLLLPPLRRGGSDYLCHDPLKQLYFARQTGSFLLPGLLGSFLPSFRRGTETINLHLRRLSSNSLRFCKFRFSRTSIIPSQLVSRSLSSVASRDRHFPAFSEVENSRLLSSLSPPPPETDGKRPTL